MLFSSVAIVALFGLALTRDRTRVASFWAAATVQAQGEEAVLAASVPTMRATAALATLQTELGANATDGSGSVPPASEGTQVALADSATLEDAPSRSTDTLSTEPTVQRPDVTASPQGSAAEAPVIPAVNAGEEAAALSDTAADTAADTAEDVEAAVVAAVRTKATTGDSLAQTDASITAAADGDTPFRLPTPTPVPTLVAGLATTPAPTPEIGDAVSITFPVTGTGAITLATPTPEIGEPVSITFPVTGTGSITAATPTPEIGEPVSITFPITGTASVTTATPTPEIGEPVSITFPITQVAAVVTPTAVATRTPTPTPVATPQPTPAAAPTASPTPAACPDGRSGVLVAGAKFYAGPLVAYDQAARMAVTLVVDNVLPADVGTDRLNLYLSDRAQFTRIVEEAEQPRENHIEAGVRSSEANGALTAAIGRPVGEFFVTIVNDSGTDAIFCLTIENGALE